MFITRKEFEDYKDKFERMWIRKEEQESARRHSYDELVSEQDRNIGKMIHKLHLIGEKLEALEDYLNIELKEKVYIKKSNKK